MITIILPVYNEELILKENTLKVFNFCKSRLKVIWQIIISDNASDDKTSEIGKKLAEQYPEIKYFKTKQQGKGWGVILAWQNFKSDIYIYMDADLSTGLNSLPDLINGIKQNNNIV